MKTYRITSIKHTELFTGSFEEAVSRAIAIEEEYQPAYGVTVEDGDDCPVAEIRDGKWFPPDPDEYNQQRADYAMGALDAFAKITGAGPDEALPDLLANLMHWCNRNDQNFSDALEQARGYYHEETTMRPRKAED